MDSPQSALRPGAAVRILPAGDFRARDGRPEGLGGWRLDAGIASNVVALATRRQDDFVIDYEHQTLTGKEAPAAGWFKRLEWREGKGLYMSGITWTERARAMIAACEYRYISPVFRFDKHTGAVQEVVNVALTNNPALNGLTDLAAASVAMAGLTAQIHCEPWSEDAIEQLRAQHSSEYFKRVFGFDAPNSSAVQAAAEIGLAAAIAQCSTDDQASLTHAFGHLLNP